MKEYKILTTTHMSNSPPSSVGRAKQIFSKASADHQALIRDILREEREVINMRRRSDIHTRLYEHVRRLIK
jgi:hypothetical protein